MRKYLWEKQSHFHLLYTFHEFYIPPRWLLLVNIRIFFSFSHEFYHYFRLFYIHKFRKINGNFFPNFLIFVFSPHTRMQSVWETAKKTTLTYFLVINFKRKCNIYVMYSGYFAYHLVKHPSKCFLESLFSLTASQTLKHVSTAFSSIQIYFLSCVFSKLLYCQLPCPRVIPPPMALYSLTFLSVCIHSPFHLIYVLVLHDIAGATERGSTAAGSCNNSLFLRNADILKGSR